MENEIKIMVLGFEIGTASDCVDIEMLQVQYSDVTLNVRGIHWLQNHTPVTLDWLAINFETGTVVCSILGSDLEISFDAKSNVKLNWAALVAPL